MMLPSTQFIILSGMLGSGKTSILEALLASESTADTAIIVNEAGEINIDGAVLSESSAGMPLATLSNGCVCCSLNDDLLSTVEDLVATRSEHGLPPFVRIVLECSGLSRPGPIISALQSLSGLRLRLHLITTYDCSLPALHSVDFEDAVAQLAAAQTVVLTKIDLVSAEQRIHAADDVAMANPLARIVDAFSAPVRARDAFDYPCDATLPVEAAVLAQQDHPPSRFHPRIGVFRARFDESLAWEDALDYLENITGALGEKLLRLKAVVPGERSDERVLVQSVGSTFSAPRRLQSDLPLPLCAIVIARDCGHEDLQMIPATTEVSWRAMPA